MKSLTQKFIKGLRLSFSVDYTRVLQGREYSTHLSQRVTRDDNLMVPPGNLGYKEFPSEKGTFVDEEIVDRFTVSLSDILLMRSERSRTRRKLN